MSLIAVFVPFYDKKDIGRVKQAHGRKSFASPISVHVQACQRDQNQALRLPAIT